MKAMIIVFTAVLMTVSAQATSVNCEPTQDAYDKTSFNAYHYSFNAHQGDGLFYDGVLEIGTEKIKAAALVAEGRTLVAATIVKGHCQLEVSLYNPEGSFCPRCAGSKLKKMMIKVDTKDQLEDGSYKSKFEYELQEQAINLSDAKSELKCHIPETTVKDLCVRAWSDKVTVNSDSAHGNQ